jgi:hypothetical protein
MNRYYKVDNNRAVEFNVQRGVYVPAEAGEAAPPPVG